ncbi:helix-turn-helix transcriptional regulator [uncultured Clostridium sp.]|uniref:helix-turn-helix domain-containing protein n=1 Tax=uncultured Clostridium sp. TaxID=59620 RepID=UPI0026040EAA|nr:helix-turn-helix transcriptional regulator [uncultured Clostridium sp.]
MIGLEFICKYKNISYTELAGSLGIGKQGITNWVTGKRKIPQKHLDTLKELFKINEVWFQKELSENDKTDIKEMLYEGQQIREDEFEVEMLVYFEEIDKITRELKNFLLDKYCENEKPVKGLEDGYKMIKTIRYLITTLKDPHLRLDTIVDVMNTLRYANHYSPELEKKGVQMIRHVIEAQNEIRDLTEEVSIYMPTDDLDM